MTDPNVPAQRTENLLLAHLIGFSGEVVTLSPAVVTEPEVSVEENREVFGNPRLAKA